GGVGRRRRASAYLWGGVGRFLLSKFFFMGSANLLRPPRRNPAGLIHDFGKLGRGHRLVGEGVESLLHLADHLLPQRERIAAFVGHRLPPPTRPLCCAIPHPYAGTVNIASPTRQRNRRQRSRAG